MARNHTKRPGNRPPGPAGNRPQSGQLNRPERDNPGRDRPGHEKEGGPVWLWGTHAVLAALANPDRQFLQFLATENAAERLPKGQLTPQIITGKKLDQRLPPGAVHQGIAVKAEPLEAAALEDLIAEGATRVAVLDQVSDPHNLGAIFRSAAAFGFTGLILQTRHAPPISGVVAKSAAGAIETVTEVRAVNIARALEQLAEAGFHTVGLAGESTRPLDLAVKGAAKVAVVLGAEGAGLRPAVAKACAELARIPIASDMESLNVSNAAAIAFYEASRGSFPVA
ncbi:MAG: RNA methyltransferase [Hyphomonas sp.]|uniref:TrmH family RNA methyltransferase n=1 Tax=Hyphomonas sp. TaxID=87 RepID=UPI0034A07342